MTDPDEPARRLYDALRAAGMIPQAWGEWEQLAATSPAAQHKLRHAAALLWPEPEQGVAPAEEPAAVDHEHEWDCAACRHDVVVLYCRRCPVIRTERL